MEKKKGQHHAHAHADSHFLADRARGVSAGERRGKREKGRRHGKWGKSYCTCNYYFSVGTGDVAVVITGGIGKSREIIGDDSRRA